MVITKKTGLKGMALVLAYIVSVVLINTLGADVSAQSEIGGGPQSPASQALIEPLSIDPFITETGNITLSIDGLGTLAATGTIEVQKPAGATVRAAFLAAATIPGPRILANGDVKINGNDVTWDTIVPGGFGTPGNTTSNGFADVTSIVKPIVDAAAPGLSSLTITEVNSTTLDGEVLAVIFDDPNQTTINTVIILFGAQSSEGDTFIVNTADPINPVNPIDLSFGISFGFQPGGQFSIVDVNGVRLTSSAGGQDDGQGANGALLTVGGIGDSNTNPPPFADDSGGPRTDDELYDLRPFVVAGDTTITINTQNPSNNDNIFFAAFFFKDARAAIDDCVLTCSPDISTSNDSGRCGATVNFPAPTTSESCGPVTCVRSDGQSGFFFPLGTTTVTCTAQSSENNVFQTSCSFTITVTDTEAPKIVSCPRDIVQNADLNQCSAVVNYPVPGVTDNCPGASIICIPPSGERLEAGTSKTVTCTATDAVGRKSECSFKISVQDAQPPTIVCPTTPVQIDAGGACTVTVPDITSSVRNSVSDACTPAANLTITQTPAANSSVGSDLRSINVTVSDGAGVSTTCQVPVTVINSGGQAAQVTIGSGSELDLSVNLLSKKKKKKKVKPAVATGTFTVKNVKCDRTSLTLPFGGVRRVTDAGAGKPINNPDDNKFFSVFTGCGNLRTKLNVGQNVTIGFNEEVCFTVEFTPTIPPVGTATTNLSASEVLPGDFKSEVLLAGISPVMIRARVASEVKLIDPATGDSNNPVVTLCQSGTDQFTVRYHAWSPSKADVRSVKYDFLDSSGGTIKTIDVDLAGPISGTSLVNGQSFNVEQSFSGTGVSSVRVTLNGPSSSSTATSGSISPSCPSAIQLQSQQRATLFLPGLTVDAVKP